MQSRRDFLKLAAMLTGAAGISGVGAESIQRAFAIEPAAGSTFLDAEHIVILMQENRSFDHAFGTCVECVASTIHAPFGWRAATRCLYRPTRQGTPMLPGD